jgi:hypothetical protein
MTERVAAWATPRRSEKRDPIDHALPFWPPDPAEGLGYGLVRDGQVHGNAGQAESQIV